MKSLGAGLACAFLLAACTSSHDAGSSASLATAPPSAVPSHAQSAAPSSGSPAAAAPSSASPTSSAPVPRVSPAGTKWLCFPGLKHNPCDTSEATTAIGADLSQRAAPTPKQSDPPIDCFYVYPTVSTQPGPNANLHIDPAEVDVAVAQAARFSSVCRVYAPMYPQLTLSAIGGNAGAAPAIRAYLGVLKAWQDYLAHDNDGRGVVVIGHSQGAFLLTALLKREVDQNPAVRKRLVSAVLLGGNVLVPQGKRVGGSFAHIPACRSGGETGCVVAYSSFDTTPAANSLFGRAATDIGRQMGLPGRDATGMQVVCTNPAALDGSNDRLRPYFPSSTQTVADVPTPWVSYPGEYTGHCENRDGADWLQVDTAVAGDQRPVVQARLGDTWGLHTVDVNIALGNLVRLVAKQSAAYAG